MPMPPSCAIAIASRASVTVSMAADTRGRFRAMLRDRRVASEVSLGRTWENAGTNNTSSKVSAFPSRRMSELQKTNCSDRPSVLSRVVAARRPVKDCSEPRRGVGRDCRVGRYTRAMNAARTLMVALACVLPLSAMAQWQWIDKSGRHVFSAQAPPPDIPAKSIVNGPKGRAMPAPEQDAAAVPAAPDAAAAAAPRVAGRDKDLEARK